MFFFQNWVQTFKDHHRKNDTAYNDAVTYGVVIDKPQNPIWRVLGVHHLTGDENQGNHNVFVEMLCKQNQREGFRAIHWTWEGRQADQPAPDVFAGQKAHNEVVDLPLNLGMGVSVWTNGSEIVKGFSSNHADEEEGNTVGHHSFFVCFQEIGEPDPDPDPEPPKDLALMVSKEWLDSLTVDDDGFIRIYR